MCKFFIAGSLSYNGFQPKDQCSQLSSQVLNITAYCCACCVQNWSGLFCFPRPPTSFLLCPAFSPPWQPLTFTILKIRGVGLSGWICVLKRDGCRFTSIPFCVKCACSLRAREFFLGTSFFSQI